MQESFFEAYEKLDDLRQPEKFAGWLRTLATNQCRMWQRRRRVGVDSLDAPWNIAVRETLADPEARTEARLENHERQELVEDVLALLPEQARLALTLFYMNQLSYKQISRFLDVPLSTVKIRIHKAKKYLRKEAMEMVEEILGKQDKPEKLDVKEVAGIFCRHEHGYGFLRAAAGAAAAPEDIYVSPSQIQRFALKPGDKIKGQARPPKGVGQGERYFALIRFDQINQHKAVMGIFCGHERGYGFLRTAADAAAAPEDIYVSPSQVERYGLKPGDAIKGHARPPKGVEQGERYFALSRFEEINGQVV